MGTPARRWSEELAGWAIDAGILAAAPETPWGFPPELFRTGARPDAGPTVRLVREILVPPGRTVVDVGSGGGAASVPALGPGTGAVAVDESPDMLAEYADAARNTGAAVRTVEGRWPDVVDQVGEADVVVCANVVYNVPDIEPFVRALHRCSRRRVVVELTERHPMTSLGALWKHFHGQERPDGPTADLFTDVLDWMGLEHRVTLSERPMMFRDSGSDMYASWTRRRLCLPVHRQPEVDALLASKPPPATTRVATVWWDR